jgi:hypothetical protein
MRLYAFDSVAGLTKEILPPARSCRLKVAVGLIKEL